MSHLLAIGLDADVGIQRVLEAGDIIGLGSNDFAFGTYTGGDIEIGTTDDADFVDVDATNAKIDFTVTVPGKYLVRFGLTTRADGLESGALVTETRFRITDGTVTSAPIETAIGIPPVDLFSPTYSSPINFISFFNFTTAGVKTVKLQKKNTLSEGVGARYAKASATSPMTFGVLRVAD